jgi:hypothetical protein
MWRPRVETWKYDGNRNMGTQVVTKYNVVLVYLSLIGKKKKKTEQCLN